MYVVIQQETDLCKAALNQIGAKPSSNGSENTERDSRTSFSFLSEQHVNVQKCTTV